MVITTENFKPTSGLYAGILTRRWFINNLWWILVPLIGLWGLGLYYDSKFFVVGLIYIISIFSFSQALFFYHFALHPEIVVRLSLQNWEFTPSRAAVTYQPTVIDKEHTVNPLVDSTEVITENISRLKITRRNLILTLHHDYDIYVIPLSSLRNPEDINQIYQFYEKAN